MLAAEEEQQREAEQGQQASQDEGDWDTLVRMNAFLQETCWIKCYKALGFPSKRKVSLEVMVHPA